MTQSSSPPSPDDFENLYAAPGADLESAWGTGDPDAESIRREFAPLESFVKAVGMVDYFYAGLTAFSAIMYIGFAILVALGRVSAPGLAQWPYIVSLAIETVLPFLAVVAGYGLRRLRPWAPRVQAIVCLAYFLLILLQCAGVFSQGRYKESALDLLFGVGWGLPIIGPVFLDLDGLFSVEYRSVLEKTSHIEIKPRLPMSLKIIAGLMVVLSMAGLVSIG